MPKWVVSLFYPRYILCLLERLGKGRKLLDLRHRRNTCCRWDRLKSSAAASQRCVWKWRTYSSCRTYNGRDEIYDNNEKAYQLVGQILPYFRQTNMQCFDGHKNAQEQVSDKPTWTALQGDKNQLLVCGWRPPLLKETHIKSVFLSQEWFGSNSKVAQGYSILSLHFATRGNIHF